MIARLWPRTVRAPDTEAASCLCPFTVSFRCCCCCSCTLSPEKNGVYSVPAGHTCVHSSFCTIYLVAASRSLFFFSSLLYPLASSTRRPRRFPHRLAQVTGLARQRRPQSHGARCQLSLGLRRPALSYARPPPLRRFQVRVQPPSPTQHLPCQYMQILPPSPSRAMVRLAAPLNAGHIDTHRLHRPPLLSADIGGRRG